MNGHGGVSQLTAISTATAISRIHVQSRLRKTTSIANSNPPEGQMNPGNAELIFSA